MRCSVVFGVTLRLLVIKFVVFSRNQHRRLLYQRCVITCESTAVVTGDPVDNTWHVAALTAGAKTR